MKRNVFSVSLVLISIFIATTLVFACELFSFENTNSKSLLPKPKVEESKSGLLIIMKNVTDLKYINIYRQDVTDFDLEDEKDTEENSSEDSSDKNESNIYRAAEENEGSKSEKDQPVTVNIGVVYPGKTKGSESPVYEDTFLCYDRKYRYRVRYTTKNETYLTNWSDVIEPNNAAYTHTGYDFKYQVSDSAYLLYNSDAATFVIKGKISEPKHLSTDKNFPTFQPKLAIETVEKDKEGNEKTGQRSLFTIDSVKENESIIRLRNLLSSEYFDKDIRILGIVGEIAEYTRVDNKKTEEDAKPEEPELKRLIWIECSKQLKILDEKNNNEEIETLKISSPTTNEGTDYSNPD